MDWTGYFLCWCVAFLCGSIPFAVLIGRAKGVDIRKVGSGSPGATNVGRTVGRKWGVVCFFCDVLKGLLPTLAFGFVLNVDPSAEAGYSANGALTDPVVTEGWLWAMQWVSVAIAAVLGHMFSPWIGFKGGKGVATSLGGALGLFPYVTLPGFASFAVWFAVAKTTGYVGLASIIAAATFPVFTGLNAWALGLQPAQLTVFVTLTLLLSVLVIVRHRTNLRRLIKGTEPKAAWTGKA